MSLVVGILNYIVLSIVSKGWFPDQVNPGQRVQSPEDIVKELDDIR